MHLSLLFLDNPDAKLWLRSNGSSIANGLPVHIFSNFDNFLNKALIIVRVNYLPISTQPNLHNIRIIELFAIVTKKADPQFIDGLFICWPICQLAIMICLEICIPPVKHIPRCWFRISIVHLINEWEEFSKIKTSCKTGITGGDVRCK